MRYIVTSILVMLSFPLFAQSGRPCYKKIYQITDTIPKLITSADKLLRIIASEIQIPDSLVNRKGHLMIKYVINCSGESVDLKVIVVHDYDGSPIKNDFEILARQIIPILRRELKWIPARHKGKNVDFLQILSIVFENGGISIRVTAT
jgi:hypothetical protein